MAGYKLATVQTAQGPRAAAVINDAVYDVAALTGNASYVSVQDVLNDWDNAHRALDAASKSPKGQGQPVAQAKLLAPLPLPGVIYCAGANYQDHAEEMWKAVRPAAGARPAHARPQAVVLHQVVARRHRSGRDGQDFALLEEDGLGNRACGRDRPQGEAI